MSKRKADDSDSDSVVDLTEEADVKPEVKPDVKPVAPRPFVHDIDDDDANARAAAAVIRRRGLEIRSADLPWIYASHFSPCSGSNRVTSRVLLLAQRFEAPTGTGDLVLAESEPIERGGATQFALRGAAVTRGDALADCLGLQVTIGSIVVPASDGDVAIVIGADGTVETRQGKLLVKLGTLNGENGPKLSLRRRGGGMLGKYLSTPSLRYNDYDGRLLLEAAPLAFDVDATSAL